MEPEESLRGRLLIASPALLDPNFARAVVLVVEQNDEGAMGIVLNRPSTAAVAEAVPPLEDLVGEEESVFVGGPPEPPAGGGPPGFGGTAAGGGPRLGAPRFPRGGAGPPGLVRAAVPAPV